MYLPLVSIIVPCYNQGPYLKDALESVLAQSYSRWECIIVNDGSTDETHILAKEYCRKDKRFQYINISNSGICSARNQGVTAASGYYILPLDADDTISNEYIERAIDIFRTHPDVKLVYCKAKMFGVVNKIWENQPYDYNEMLRGHNMIFASAFFKKSDFITAGGYNENMKLGLEDWDFWIRLLNNTTIEQVYKIDEFLFNYRIKDLSRSVTINSNKDYHLQMLNQSFKDNINIYIQHYPGLFNIVVEQEYNMRLLSTPIVKFGVKMHFLWMRFNKYISKLFR